MNEIVNVGLPVAGYVPQTNDKVALVNENKALEERVLRQIERVENAGISVDAGMSGIAYERIQEAFMWLNRSIFQPTRVKLPEDGV